MGGRVQVAGDADPGRMDLCVEVDQTAWALHSISGRRFLSSSLDHIWLPTQSSEGLCAADLGRGESNFFFRSSLAKPQYFGRS